jgi:uncharacterized protein
MAGRPPFPPFTLETARQKVQAAEDAWNTCDPGKVSLAYSEDSVWRNRDRFLQGRAEIVAFLTENWEFDEQGLMVRREASINDHVIDESERRIFGTRPEADRGVDIPLR